MYSLKDLANSQNMRNCGSITPKTIVIYWPLTESSIKRCICVNKWKNSGSRWALNNNITRCTDGLRQLETRCLSESQRQSEGFGPSVTHGWSTPAKMRKKCCYGRRGIWGQYSSLSLSQAHLSHTNITLLRIKCERYIFIKECVRSFIEVCHYFCIYLYVCGYTTQFQLFQRIFSILSQIQLRSRVF